MRAAAVVLATGLLACADATPPAPTVSPYPYNIGLSNGFQIVFRWPANSLPVRIYATGGGSVRQYVNDAIRMWEQVGLYGEFVGVQVGDSSRADIIIRVQIPDQQPETNALVLSGCGAVTHYDVLLDSTMALPFRTLLFPRAGAGQGDTEECYARAVAHELGHALGLLLHSDDPNDLMHSQPAGGLSARDIVTFRALYHSNPTIRVPPDRR
jgi:predicted Zn-dependent protease